MKIKTKNIEVVNEFRENFDTWTPEDCKEFFEVFLVTVSEYGKNWEENFYVTAISESLVRLNNWKTIKSESYGNPIVLREYSPAGIKMAIECTYAGKEFRDYNEIREAIGREFVWDWNAAGYFDG